MSSLMSGASELFHVADLEHGCLSRVVGFLTQLLASRGKVEAGRALSM